jgi:hypothetical protein
MKSTHEPPASGKQWGDASPGIAGIIFSLLLAFGFWCVVALVSAWVAH